MELEQLDPVDAEPAEGQVDLSAQHRGAAVETPLPVDSERATPTLVVINSPSG